ncbi:hypothetical protein FKW77_007555 [Venturia effusa]|uniref:Uncharacterized protein n=1 Tax=Venturia effusa TaxID=50376 RepID=A0A517L1M4_9PEZI|nr:hypothetical protein FKW77_007555 [Venturia effusa]
MTLYKKGPASSTEDPSLRLFEVRRQDFTTSSNTRLTMKFAIVTLVALAAHAFAEPAAIGTDPDFARPRNVRRWSGPSRQGPDGPHIVDDSSSVVSGSHFTDEEKREADPIHQVGRKRMKREINIPKGHDPVTGYTHHPIDPKCPTCNKKRVKRDVDTTPDHPPGGLNQGRPYDHPGQGGKRAKRDVNIPKGYDPIDPYHHPPLPGQGGKRAKRDVDAVTIDEGPHPIGRKRDVDAVTIDEGPHPIGRKRDVDAVTIDEGPHPIGRKRDVDAVTIDEGPHPIGRKREINIPKGPDPLGRYKHKPIDPNCPLCNKKRVKREVDTTDTVHPADPRGRYQHNPIDPKTGKPYGPPGRKREINIPKGPDPLGRYKHKPIDPNCPLCNKKRVKRDVDEQVKREVDIAPPPHKSPPDVPGKRDLDAVAIDEVSGDVGKRGVVPKGKKSPPTDIPGGNGRVKRDVDGHIQGKKSPPTTVPGWNGRVKRGVVPKGKKSPPTDIPGGNGRVKRQEPGRGQYGDDGPGGGGKVKRQEPGRGQYGDDGPGGGGKVKRQEPGRGQYGDDGPGGGGKVRRQEPRKPQSNTPTSDDPVFGGGRVKREADAHDVPPPTHDSGDDHRPGDEAPVTIHVGHP